MIKFTTPLKRNSLWGRSATERNLFQASGAQFTGNPSMTKAGEIDLRKELDEIFFGYASGIRHGYYCLIRRLRRDSQGIAEACTCLDSLTRESDPDCSYCGGEGYLFDEFWKWTYSMFGGSEAGLNNKIKSLPPGAVRVDYKIFFFRYDADIQFGDKIVEVKLDEEGRPVLPYVRTVIFQPQTIDPHRSDNGRIEYYSVYCRESDALRLDNL